MNTWIKMLVGIYVVTAVVSTILLVALADWFWDVYEFFHG